MPFAPHNTFRQCLRYNLDEEILFEFLIMIKEGEKPPTRYVPSGLYRTLQSNAVIRFDRYNKKWMTGRYFTRFLDYLNKRIEKKYKGGNI